MILFMQFAFIVFFLFSISFIVCFFVCFFVVFFFLFFCFFLISNASVSVLILDITGLPREKKLGVREKKAGKLMLLLWISLKKIMCSWWMD